MKKFVLISIVLALTTGSVMADPYRKPKKDVTIEMTPYDVKRPAKGLKARKHSRSGHRSWIKAQPNNTIEAERKPKKFQRGRRGIKMRPN